MKSQNIQLKPQDVLLLLKIISQGLPQWNQKPLADALGLSQSEVSEAVSRCKFAGLLDVTGKRVMRKGFLEFLQYGLRYVFPQRPGALVKGIPTAHSGPPLNEQIVSSEKYVWPSARGTARGQAIVPLYPSVVKAIENDIKLYELLALVDALRVGRAREKNIAIKELEDRFFPNESTDAKVPL